MKKRYIHRFVLAACTFLTAFMISGRRVEAQTGVSLGDILPANGAVFHLDLNKESCILKAKTAIGSKWGYTNLGIAKVESGNLNVRAIPGTDGKLVGKMPKGSACEIIQITEDEEWAHIKSGEVDGFVSTEFLYMGADASMKAMELIRPVATVTADALKVRDEASMDRAVLTSVPNWKW